MRQDERVPRGFGEIGERVQETLAVVVGIREDAAKESRSIIQC